ncbi:hypothetical protein DFJ77DRAFT_443104 [Powellomyces hirtus]|nr:hypothetical protein DFJ77DRAFT_443104 [Powellomyces hirtus]
MPASQYDYIATYDLHGLQKRFDVSSLQGLSQMLKISHSTAMLLAGDGQYTGKMPIRIERKRKGKARTDSKLLSRCSPTQDRRHTKALCSSNIKEMDHPSYNPQNVQAAMPKSHSDFEEVRSQIESPPAYIEEQEDHRSIYKCKAILLGMSPSKDLRCHNNQLDQGGRSFDRRTTNLDRELFSRIGRVKKHLLALHVGVKTAYMLPKHVRKTSADLQEENRSQLHLLTHMAEFTVEILEDVEIWLAGRQLQKSRPLP